MVDNSPIVLHLKTWDKTFDFFLFSMAVYDVIIYDHNLTSTDITKPPGGTSIDTYDNLRNLFLDAPEEEGGEVAISIRHLLVLLSVVDHVSKVLLGNGADELIVHLRKQFPGLSEDWVMGYLQNAGQIFESFRRQFGSHTGMEALLERLTSLNPFQERV